MATDLDLTYKQSEAYYIITKGNAKNVLLYGGARSGKSVVLASLIVHWSLKYEGLRSLIARLRFSHAKTTIWHQTVRDIMKNIPLTQWKENKADHYIEFLNGSEIWLGGFDERERIEKILGSEFNVIYLNEVSQLSYEVVEMSLPRLAKKVEGFENIALFDCNPPSPLHWSHRIFIEKVNPHTLKPLEKPELYTSLKMNPIDNKENLPDHYIENNLETLADRARRRFLDGEFVKAEGTIYEEFDESCILAKDAVPEMERYSMGIDFGLNSAAVLIGWSGDNVYVLGDYGNFNITAATLNIAIQERWQDKSYIAWCDPSGGERIQEITFGDKANNSVEPGIDAINDKIHNHQFFLVEGCNGVLSEIWDYRRDEKERIIKVNDHYMDAMRYGIFSEIAEPVQIFIA